MKLFVQYWQHNLIVNMQNETGKKREEWGYLLIIFMSMAQCLSSCLVDKCKGRWPSWVLHSRAHCCILDPQLKYPHNTKAKVPQKQYPQNPTSSKAKKFDRDNILKIPHLPNQKLNRKHPQNHTSSQAKVPHKNPQKIPHLSKQKLPRKHPQKFLNLPKQKPHKNILRKSCIFASKKVPQKQYLQNSTSSRAKKVSQKQYHQNPVSLQAKLPQSKKYP